MIAWLAASSDLDNYGQFTVLKLPKEGLEKEEIQDEFIKQENKETIV